MRRLTYTIVMALIVVLIGACSGNSGSTSPTAPTPPVAAPATIKSVDVTSAYANGNMYQLVATVRYSDGTTRVVTTAARWDSSNTSVAIVSQTGLVTIISTGNVDVRANYQGVSGSFPLLVGAPPPRATLQGTVWEVAPNQRALPGARVEIMDGPDGGKVAVADSAGNYKFSELYAGLIILKTTLSGYETWQGGFTLSGDRKEDAWLSPTPPKDRTGATATARCKDGTWTWSQDKNDACGANGGIAYFVCPGPFCNGLP